MATARVAPRFHPATQETLRAMGFSVETGKCYLCDALVIIQLVREGETFQISDPGIEYICITCAGLKQDFT